MAEPTLSEISNIKGDPMAGGGEVTPVIDNSKIVDTLNDAAKFHAENTWRKYTQFLKNKQDLFQNISDIQGLETAQQDRENLKNQAAEIFRAIEKDPSAVMGGRGFDELQGKIIKFKGDSMTSKQDKADYDADSKFIAANPELDTDDNAELRKNFWNPQIGQRKSVMLRLPTIFDEKTAVEGGIKEATTKTEEVVGRNGQPGTGYIASISTFDPEKFKTSWGMIAKGGQIDKNAHDLKKAVEERYSHLSPDVKEKYDKEGGIEAYWADKGEQYIKAYFKDGKYRVVTDIKPDTGYLVDEKFQLEKDKFAQDKKEGNARIAQEWRRIGLAEAEVKKEDEDTGVAAFGVLNQIAGVLKNAKKIDVVGSNGVKRQLYRINDVNLLQKFATLDRDGKEVNRPDAMNFDDQTNEVILLYYSDKDKLAMQGKATDPVTKKLMPPKTGNFRYDREIHIDQRTWANKIAESSIKKAETFDRAQVLINKTILANSNSIWEVSKILNAAPTQGAPAAPAKNPQIGAPKKWDKYKVK